MFQSHKLQSSQPITITCSSGAMLEKSIIALYPKMAVEDNRPYITLFRYTRTHGTLRFRTWDNTMMLGEKIVSFRELIELSLSDIAAQQHKKNSSFASECLEEDRTELEMLLELESNSILHYKGNRRLVHTVPDNSKSSDEFLSDLCATMDQTRHVKSRMSSTAYVEAEMQNYEKYMPSESTEMTSSDLIHRPGTPQCKLDNTPPMEDLFAELCGTWNARQNYSGTRVKGDTVQPYGKKELPHVDAGIQGYGKHMPKEIEK